jgi:ABC-type glycerol-3-phosphate transport system substrate-binding protein
VTISRSRYLAAVAAATLLAGALASCSSSGGKPKSGGRVTISFQEQFSNAEAAQFDKLLATFETAHPDIKVKLIRDNAQSYYDKLVTQIVGGSAPDLVRVDPPHASQYVASGWAAPLGSAAGNKDDYFPASLDSVTKDGQLYGVPVDVSALALFYRTDLFSAAGISAPPTTWDEFTADAAKLTHGGQHGAGLFGGWGAFEFYPWLWQAGADVLSPDGKSAVFNSPEAVKALQLWVDLEKSGSMPAGMATATEDDLKGPFVSGKLAMLTSGPWMIPSLKQAKIDGKWAVAPLPKGAASATVLGGLDLLALKQSKHLKQDKTFVSWLMSDDVEKQWATALGYVPVKKSLYSDPVFASDKTIAAFQGVMEQAKSRPTVAKAAKVDDAFGKAVQAALSGASSAKAALDQGVKSANEALSG